MMTDEKKQPAKPAQPTALAPISREVASVRKLLEDSKAQLAAALPRFIRPENMIRVAMTEIQRNSDLLACSRRSLIGAIFQASQLGLSLDSQLGQAYLVPFKNEVTLISGYRGLIQLALRTEQVSSIRGEVVRADDRFDYEYGTKPFLMHKPALVDKIDERDQLRGVIAAYAVAIMSNGQTHFTVMSRSEVERIRQRSPAYRQNHGPWITDSVAMFQKTPTRQLCKWLPVQTERAEAERMVSAISLDERAESNLSQDLASMAPVYVLDADADAASKLDKLSGVIEQAKTREPGEDG